MQLFFQNKFKQLAEQLKLAERCKSQLEMELDRLQNELKAMRRELDEEAQRRCNLEQLVCQQKAEIECLQDELCLLRGELDQIGIINEDLKNQMRHGMHDTQRFTQEIIDMQGALRERDEEIRRLKDALDRCCKYNKLAYYQGIVYIGSDQSRSHFLIYCMQVNE